MRSIRARASQLVEGLFFSAIRPSAIGTIRLDRSWVGAEFTDDARRVRRGHACRTLQPSAVREAQPTSRYRRQRAAIRGFGADCSFRAAAGGGARASRSPVVHTDHPIRTSRRCAVRSPRRLLGAARHGLLTASRHSAGTCCERSTIVSMRDIKSSSLEVCLRCLLPGYENDFHLFTRWPEA
jgi:hypothetical protein